MLKETCRTCLVKSCPSSLYKKGVISFQLNTSTPKKKPAGNAWNIRAQQLESIKNGIHFHTICTSLNFSLDYLKNESISYVFYVPACLQANCTLREAGRCVKCVIYVFFLDIFLINAFLSRSNGKVGYITSSSQMTGKPWCWGKKKHEDEIHRGERKRSKKRRNKGRARREIKREPGRSVRKRR